MGNAKLSDLMEFRKLFSMWFFSHSLLWLSIRVEQRRWKTIDNWLRWTFVVIQRKKKKNHPAGEKSARPDLLTIDDLFTTFPSPHWQFMLSVCGALGHHFPCKIVCCCGVLSTRVQINFSFSRCMVQSSSSRPKLCNSSNEILWCECTKCSANIKLTTKSLKLQQLKLRIASLTLWANIA